MSFQMPMVTCRDRRGVMKQAMLMFRSPLCYVFGIPSPWQCYLRMLSKKERNRKHRAMQKLVKSIYFP